MNATIETLLNRSSAKFVTSPGPSDEELEQILQAAMSAPDHGALVPWRIKVIRGEAVKTFADFALDLRNKQDPIDPEVLEANRAWLHEIPLILSVSCYIDYSNTKISEEDREYATACAMMQILNACHALGYGAFWASGLATGIPEFQSAMGFDALDHRDMGYIVIGTPKFNLPSKQRASYKTIAQEWTRPLTDPGS